MKTAIPYIAGLAMAAAIGMLLYISLRQVRGGLMIA
jgi:hypothetical protein